MTIDLDALIYEALLSAMLSKARSVFGQVMLKNLAIVCCFNGKKNP